MEKRCRRQLSTVILSAFLAGLSAAPASVLAEEAGSREQVRSEETADANSNTPSIRAESALVIDYDTGQILLEQNSNQTNEIASLTKMITQYIVFEEIEAGNLAWDDEVKISAYASELSVQPGLANVPLEAGKTHTVKELFEAMSIYSANAATYTLAEHIEGTEANFVDRMRALLENWGVDSSHIYNSTGLNNIDLMGNYYPGSGEKDENMLTAQEVAVVALHLLEDYPDVLKAASVPVHTFSPGTPLEREMLNWNWMLEGLEFEREGVVGLKTGTTLASGANFVGAARDGNGRRLLTVIMNAGDGLVNRSQRFIETNKMMEYGFNEWALQPVTQAGESIAENNSVQIHNGTEAEIDLLSGETLEMMLPDDPGIENIQVDYKLDKNLLTDDGKVKAPIDAGEELGAASIILPEEVEYIALEEFSETGEAKSLANFEVPLVAGTTVEQVSLLTRVKNWLRSLI